MFKFTPHTLTIGIRLMSLLNMLIGPFNKPIDDKFLSDTCIPRKPNKNLPPLICLHLESFNSRQSVWNRDVKTYLYYFSITRSSIRDAIHWRVMTRAVSVRLFKVKFWEFLLCRLCQSSCHFVNSGQNKGFLPSLTAASPIQKFVLNSCPPDINKFQRRRNIQPIWVIAFNSCKCALIENC